MGKITLIIGCMFSGKSSEIIKIYNKYKNEDEHILLINHKTDTRYGRSVMSSHNKTQLPCFTCLELAKLVGTEMYNKADIIMIDEAQFFPDLFDFATNAADIHNKELFIAGLDGDYKKKPFGDILKLISHCDDIIKLKAYCKHCNNKNKNAIFTKRIVDNEQQFLVGGYESYIPVCRKHYTSPS
jgi:thymidine kinase